MEQIYLSSFVKHGRNSKVNAKGAIKKENFIWTYFVSQNMKKIDSTLERGG
jgi:hypothetical protein